MIYVTLLSYRPVPSPETKKNNLACMAWVIRAMVGNSPAPIFLSLLFEPLSRTLKIIDLVKVLKAILRVGNRVRNYSFDRQISGMSWRSCYKNIVYKYEKAL